MSTAEAYAALINLRVPVFRTGEVAAILGMSTTAANKTLKRLSKAQLVVQVRSGLWATGKNVDPLILPEYLTAPYPSYTSLQTALYLHGMISQIPQVIYAVSLSRTQTIRTRVGAFAIHHIAPEFFGGFKVVAESGIKLAEPEKALLDIFYLAGRKNRRFEALPEIELPPNFSERKARHWTRRIQSPRDRAIVSARLDAILRRS